MKSLILIIILLQFNNIIAQKTYYLANNGSDGNNGLSESTPWETISKINASMSSFKAGDQILFKSGDIFDDAFLQITSSGNENNNLIFSSYGSGNLPIIGNAKSKFEQAVFINNADFITISGLQILAGSNSEAFKSNGINIYGIGNIIEKCEIKGSNKSTSTKNFGISLFSGSKKTIIQKNEISNFGGGIGGGNFDDVLIQYNKIHMIYIADARANKGARCIDSWSNEKNSSNKTIAWDAKYKLIIKNNDLYNFDHSAIGLSHVSNYIVEYNYIHDPLDETQYPGGVKHGTVGKLFDQTYMAGNGSTGAIFRYNVVMNFKRFGKINTTYKNGQVIGSNNYGRPVYLGNGSEEGTDFGDTPDEVPDAIISGLGYGNIWIHNNLFINIDHKVFGQGYSSKYNISGQTHPFKDNLASHIYYNTFYNVQKLSWTGNASIYVDNTDVPSPLILANNIFHVGHSVGEKPFIRTSQNSKGFSNLFVNRSGFFKGETDIPKNLAYYQRYGERYNKINDEKTDLYETDPKFINISEFIFIENIGVEGVNIPNLFLTTNSPALNKATPIGNDPTGKNIDNNNLLNSNRQSNSIGALDILNSTVSDSPVLKVYLEGSFSENKMSTILSKNNWLPNTQPYFESPWNLIDNIDKTYSGNDIVDWIIVELRSNENTILKSKAALLKEDGTVLNPNGKKLSFDNIETGKYFIVIRHRNHLDVMSANKVDVVSSQSISYNFTDSQSKAFGNNAMIQLPNGNFAMYSGDGDNNNIINNLDFGKVANSIPQQGYHNSDLDMNGVVNVLDYNKINKNILKGSQVPN